MGRIEDFERELRRRGHNDFGTWHKIDLHNHTPGSGSDYRYHESDIAERLVERINASDLSVVMFADHGQLPDATLVKIIAEKSGKLILRGVELSVFVDAWQKPYDKVDKLLFFHLLIGFDPSASPSPDYWIDDIWRRCKQEKRRAGTNEVIGVSASIDELCKVLQEANAIIIPAHLHSSHDAFKSRSIDDIYRDPEFLRHAKEHFTALEVKSQATAAYFDGKHSETNFLYKTCICSSDSHEPNALGSDCCFVQMQETTFAQLKAALELPFRTSLSTPDKPPSYVVGVHIQGQFLADLWIPFSPHCNALIGVKGSGKTSVLESLRFVLGADVPDTRLQAVTDHLNAILGAGGKVSALIKRHDGARILVERSVTDKMFVITFEDGRQERLSRPEGMHFAAYVLGWHEIEQAATDVNVRRMYMDSIAGREQVRALTERAESHAATIRNIHERASNAYANFRQLEQQVTRLNELRRGLQELTDANLIELRNQYQAAIEHRAALEATVVSFRQAQENAKSHFEKLVSGWDRKNLEGPSPIDAPIGEALIIVDEVVSSLNRESLSFEEQLRSAVEKFVKLGARVSQEFQSFSEEYSKRLAQLSKEQRELLESHRKVMAETGNLPGLEREREKAKVEVESLLRELIELCGQVILTLDERSALRKRTVDEFSKDLQALDVRMSVTGLQPAQQFQDLNQRYTHGAAIWSELRSKNADRLGHISLKKGYENLLKDLLSGYALFFQNPEFGFFVSIFEDDDLQIELNVSKSATDYRQIGQLSAGQRCTAIFPVLLKQQAGPLIIDQPEDNLDNRHIASAIGPVILDDKRLTCIIHECL